MVNKRTQARIVLHFTSAATLLLVGLSLWLFASNVGQLWPQAAGRTFGGGFYKDAYFWRSAWLTVATASLTTLIACAVGIPASYALSRYRIPFRGAIDVLFSSVLILPASSVGLCLLIVFQYGPLFELQEALGFRVAHSIFPGIVMAQLVLSLAMGMSAWRAAFDRVPRRFEHVARSLGSRPFHVFRNVTLPLARGGILTGIVLAFTRASAEFGAVLLFCATFKALPPSRFSPATRALGLNNADIFPIAMWAEFEYGNVEYGYAILFSLAVLGALSVFFLHRVGSKAYVW